MASADCSKMHLQARGAPADPAMLRGAECISHWELLESVHLFVFFPYFRYGIVEINERAH